MVNNPTSPGVSDGKESVGLGKESKLAFGLFSAGNGGGLLTTLAGQPAGSDALDDCEASIVPKNTVVGQ